MGAIIEDMEWTPMAVDAVITIINMMVITVEGTQTNVVTIMVVTATVAGVTGIWNMKADTMEVMEEIGGEEIAIMIVKDMEGAAAMAVMEWATVGAIIK